MNNPNLGRPYLFLINLFINQGSCELEATTSENKHVLNYVRMYLCVCACMYFSFLPGYLSCPVGHIVRAQLLLSGMGWHIKGKIKITVLLYFISQSLICIARMCVCVHVCTCVCVCVCVWGVCECRIMVASSLHIRCLQALGKAHLEFAASWR